MYLRSNVLLLADVFENFKNIFIKIYGLDPAKFLSAPGLVWQAALKKTGVELELLTDTDMLLIVETGIRGGICHAIHHYPKAYHKYMKDIIKLKNHHILNIGMQIIYMTGQCHKSFL